MNLTNVCPPLYAQTYINVGVGRPVILLHGLFGNINMWQPLVDHLKSDFNVIVPRLPLFDLPIQHNNLKHLVKVLHEFIEWNKFSTVVIVGHAVGAQLGLLYAHNYPPSSGSVGFMRWLWSFEDALLDDALNQQVIEFELVSKRVHSTFYNQPAEASKLANEIYLNVQNIPKRLALNSYVRSSKQSSVSSFLSQLIIPVQLIWGLQDKISSPEVALHFHDLLPNAEVKFIDQCGHMPMVEKPEEFKTLVSDFLEKGILSKAKIF